MILQITQRRHVFQCVGAGLRFMAEISQGSGTLVSHAMDKLAPAGGIIRHPGHMEPARLTAHVNLPPRLILKLGVLLLLHIIEDGLNIVVPRRSPGGRRSGERQIEVDFLVRQPLAHLGTARARVGGGIVVTELEYRPRPTGRRRGHRVAVGKIGRALRLNI